MYMHIIYHVYHLYNLELYTFTSLVYSWQRYQSRGQLVTRPSELHLDSWQRWRLQVPGVATAVEAPVPHIKRRLPSNLDVWDALLAMQYM